MTTTVVSSGFTSSGLNAGSGDFINVLSGGSLKSSTDLNGGTINISAGGKVDHLTVSSGGTLNVAGTFLSNGNIVAGGVENVQSGGLHSGASGAGTALSGTMNVLAGGSATFVGVQSGGILNVAGVTLSNVLVSSGGTENVLSGGLISGNLSAATIVSASGILNVSAGGSAAFVGVSSGGTFNVAGKVLSNVAVFSGGVENILSGGFTSGVTGSGTGVSGGTLNISSGGSGTFIGVSSGGIANVSSGGTLQSSTDYFSGTTNILSGGTADHLTVSGGGILNVAGTVASNTTVSSGGIENVSSGGLISGATGSGTGISGGTVNILAGGTAVHVGVSSGGTLNVAGVLASHGTVTSGGIENILSGGLISGATSSGTGVSAGGVLNVLAGGSATHVGVSSGGIFNVAGTVLSNVGVYSGGVENVQSGGKVLGTSSSGTGVSGGTLNILAGGSAGFVGVSSGGVTNVSSGGNLSNTTDYDSAVTNVLAGGQIFGATVSSGGTLNIAGLVLSNATVLSGGIENILSGGLASGASGSGTAVSGGTINVSSGGRIAHSTDYVGGVTNVLAGGLLDNATISSGGLINVVGTTLGNVSIMDGGVENVSSGGLVSGSSSAGNTISSGGMLNVLAGGSAAFVGVSSGGIANVSSSGNLQNTTDYDGGVTNVLAGGKVANATVSSGGTLKVAGTVLSNTAVMTGGIENVLSGGLIGGATGSGTGIFGGTVNLSAGGSAAFVGVSGGGTFNVAGTVLSSVAVYAGGIENILAGGVASGASGSGTGVSGGILNVSSGGRVAFSTDYTGGITNILNGGSGSNLAVSSGGMLNVAGVTLSNVTVFSGGVEHVLSGGVASGTVISGGTVEVDSGGSVSNKIVFAGSGGTLQIDNTIIPAGLVISGLADGDHIDLRGVAFVSGGGVHLLSGNVLEVTENSTNYDLQLNPTDSFTGLQFNVTDDGTGHTKVNVYIDHAPVAIASASNVNATHNQTFAASNLFSATDADGDAITKYQLWDDEGHGHWVVNGAQQATNAAIDITAAQLAQTIYQSGSGADHLYVRANDGSLWGAWTPAFTVTGPIDLAPVVTPTSANYVLAHGQTSIAASSLFMVSDPEGDTIAQYALWDTEGNGHWVVNGVQQATNAEIDITPAQLAQTVYVSNFGLDNVYVRANDSSTWSAWKPFSISAGTNHAPTVSASNVTATHNQTFAATSLFSATDPDGDAITTYAVWDTEGNGHWVVNGVTQATNAEIDLTPAQLAQTVYMSGSGTDTLYARANDGTTWGAWKPFTVTGPADQGPVATATLASRTLAHGTQTIAATSLFSATDPEGDAIVKYGLWDTEGNGHWAVNGAVQATNTEVIITAAQLAQTVYQSGPLGTDHLYVRAYDGTLPGAWTPAFTVTAASNAAPTVSASNVTATHNQTFAATSLFSATDPDGDAITTYAVWDTEGNGHWVVNGVTQATNAEIDLTPAQLAQTVYMSGSGTDTLYARANDGTTWGAWKPFTVTGPADQGPVATATLASRTLAHGTQTIAATSLFSATDPEGDAIVKYGLWDTEGNGHWAVNGAVQATNTEVIITAAQLAQTVYQSGPLGTDHLYVRAYDGTLPGAWTPAFTVTAASNAAPTVSASNVTATHNQTFAATSLFSATDPDGDAITTYAVWDTEGNGHWVVNGVTQATNAEIDLTPAQLAQTVYMSGSGTDTLYARANDGTTWGAWKPFTVTGPLDGAPIAAATQASRSAARNATFAATSLFTTSDPEGDTIATYALWDTEGNGHWFVNGVQQATNAETDLTPAQLAQTVYKAGSGTDTLYVRVNDGSVWGAWTPAFTVTGAADQAPTATAVNVLTVPGQVFAATSLFTAADADGDTITKFALWDTQGNGHLFVNGMQQATNAEIDVTPAQLAQTTYVAGTGSDQLYARANDGLTWGAWTPAVTANGANPANIASGATMELTGASSAAVTFLASTGTLKLDNSASFAGTVAGLSGSDAIDFADVNFATIQTPTYTGSNTTGTLHVTDGTHVTNVTLFGDYLASTWTTSNDGHGGTRVVDPSADNNNLLAPHV